MRFNRHYAARPTWQVSAAFALHKRQTSAEKGKSSEAADRGSLLISDGPGL